MFGQFRLVTTWCHLNCLVKSYFGQEGLISNTTANRDSPGTGMTGRRAFMQLCVWHKVGALPQVALHAETAWQQAT